MKIEWMILAEGIGTDAAGVLTVIGLNRNIFASPELPGDTKRGVVVRIVETSDGNDPLVEGCEFSLSVKAPSGGLVSFQTGRVAFGGKRYPDLPGAFDIPAELYLAVTEYGTYHIEFAINFADGTSDFAAVPLYSLAGQP